MVVNMFQQLLFLIIIITNAVSAEMCLPCAPGEVTQPYNFTANINQQNVPVLWKRDDANIALCSSSNTCTLLGDRRNMYEATRSGQITSLQIKNVTTQSSGVYTCEGGGSMSFICDFKVYAKPDIVTCQGPEFRAATQDVVVVCTVEGIYPKLVCQFSWFIDNTESRVISGSPSNFNQNCSFSLPAHNFTLGKHQFQLMAYPNVTGQDSDVVYGKNSTPTSLQSVVSPAVTLNCAGTTVQEDKQVSCTCRETNNTFILATTTLFYGTANISSALQHITAPITVNRYTSEIICQAQLPEGTKTNKTKSINVYYSPSNVSVRVFYNQTESDVISLCGQSITVTVTCNVTVNNVSPGVNYHFYSNVTAAHSNVTAEPLALPNMAAVNYTVRSGGMFYFLCTVAPTILSFDINNTSEQIIIERNSTVSFTCQAEGNPSPSLSLRKNGTELHHFNDSTRNFNLTLTYNMAMSKCLDTGVYMCHAGDGQTTTSKTVTVYVKCVQQFTSPESLRHNITEHVNGTVWINVPVFGYPEPNVNLNSSKYTISSDVYNLTYMKQEPPYGDVSLMINIENASFFQSYSLNINNAEGQLTYLFEIVEGDPEPSGPETRGPPGQDVGAIVGGIVAAVLVIVVISVIIFLLKRKVNAPARKVDTDSEDQEVEIDNIIYNMDITAETDNSDLYNMNPSELETEDTNPCEHVSSQNKNMPEPSAPPKPKRCIQEGQKAETAARDQTYAPIVKVPKSETEDTNPCEHVSSQNKNKPEPSAPPKPKRCIQEGQKAETAARDQTYAPVVEVPKSDKPFAIKEDKDEFFVDPSLQLEVPDKNIVNP